MIVIKKRYIKKVRRIVLCLAVTILIGYGSERPARADAPDGSREPDVTLDLVQISNGAVQFYLAFGADSAVLGFWAMNDSGDRRYFPMYGSSYRGIPPVTLEVFVSDTEEEMWVHSSWSGYEELAYHRIGTDRLTTVYGEMSSFEEPLPESLVGRTRAFPTMDTQNVSKVATLHYPDQER